MCKKSRVKSDNDLISVSLMRSRVFFKLSDIDCFLLFADPAGFEGISGKLNDLFFGEVKLAGQLIVVLADVAAEVFRQNILFAGGLRAQLR